MSASPASGKESNASARGYAKQDLRLAWIGVALVPVCFAVAMVLGEGAIDLLGYPSGGEVAPLWIAALVGVPATLLMLVPGAIAFVYGRRARREGLPRGLVPAVIGAVVVFYLVVVTVAWLAGLT